MKKSIRQITVELSIEGENCHVGELEISHVRGKETFVFYYSEEWLANKDRFAIDPELPLVRGRQYPQNGSTFGCFEDASPDRWGRALMKRAGSGEKSSFLPSDFLLGVMDELRSGGLRFKENGEYLSSKMEGVPKLKSINEFYDILKNYTATGEISDDDIKDVIGPGSSLGGARPKLTLYDDNGQLYIVKFPNNKDEVDVQIWEMVSLEIAKNCGIQTSPAFLHKLPSGKHALVIERFDRKGATRVHFASAMTLLNAKDGDTFRTYSYLDIAEVIAVESIGADSDLKELWVRMQFNVLTTNRDDHLRNHGFLRSKNGWNLSPVYDLESNSDKTVHCLALDDKGDCRPDPHTAIEMAEFFGLSREESIIITRNMCKQVARFEDIAKKYGASAKEINQMRGNFVTAVDGIGSAE